LLYVLGKCLRRKTTWRVLNNELLMGCAIRVCDNSRRASGAFKIKEEREQNTLREQLTKYSRRAAEVVGRSAICLGAAGGAQTTRPPTAAVEHATSPRAHLFESARLLVKEASKD
jgi:hypothetical protein